MFVLALLCFSPLCSFLWVFICTYRVFIILPVVFFSTALCLFFVSACFRTFYFDSFFTSSFKSYSVISCHFFVYSPSTIFTICFFPYLLFLLVSSISSFTSYSSFTSFLFSYSSLFDILLLLVYLSFPYFILAYSSCFMYSVLFLFFLRLPFLFLPLHVTHLSFLPPLHPLLISLSFFYFILFSPDI